MLNELNWRRLLSLGLRVVLVLVLVDYLVATFFVDRFILARYAAPYPVLRDRTSGRNTSIFFTALERAPNPGVRVAFVGDSTMNSADGPDQTFLPMLVQPELQRLFPHIRVETLDASLLGLYGSSAALFIAKLLGRDTDVIVYGVTPRAFPTHPTMRWVSTVSSELDPGDLGRIARAGGVPWLMNNLDSESFLSGLIKSYWTTFAYRSQLRLFLYEFFHRPLSRLPTSLVAPQEDSLQQVPRDRAALTYEWTRDEYSSPNENWQALLLIGELCRRYAPGRCVLYASPINPLLRERLYEPGLYDDYLSDLRVVAGRYGLIFRDYTDALAPADFRKPKYGGLRDPIHMNTAGRTQLGRLLLEPLSVAIGHTGSVQALQRPRI